MQVLLTYFTPLMSLVSAQTLVDVYPVALFPNTKKGT